MATITVKDSSNADVAIEKPNANGQATMANSRPVVLALDHAPIPLAEITSWLPAYDGSDGGSSPLHTDDLGNLNCRSQILTDEGGFRVNFANASTWASIGSLTFTNGSDQVTGGTNLLSLDVNIGDYVRLDSEGVQVQVAQITNAAITLVSAYSGTGGTGAASRSKLSTGLAGDATFTVSNGQALFTSGVNANQVSWVARLIDVPALVSNIQLTLSQRIANAAFYFGFSDNPNPNLAKSYAMYLFDGTTATAAKMVTARNPITVPTAGEIQTTALTIATTASASEFRIELLRDRSIALQNDLIKGANKVALPAQSDMMYFVMAWVSGGTAPASNTTATIDFAQVANNNEIAVSFITREPQVVQSSTANPVVARITDGTNYMPTMDAAARRGYMTVTDGTNAMPTGDAAARGIYHRLTDGTNTAAVLATILALKTDLSSIAGTATVNGGVAGTLAVGGNVAHSAARTANPVTVGGQVTTTLDTTLTQGDAAYLMQTTAGQLIVKLFGSAENDWQYTGTLTTSTAVAAKAAGAASIRNYVTGVTVQNTNATATTFLIQDGATTIFQISLPASMTTPLTFTFPTPLKGTAATALNVNCGTTGANVLTNIQGYQSF